MATDSPKPPKADLDIRDSAAPLEESGIELERAEEIDIAVPFNPDEIDVITKGMTIDLILSRVKSGAINLQPDFQRRWGIWSVRRQSRLIESLLLRIPLPTFYAAEDQNEEWEIVDGIQRISTIARFVDPELLGDDGFELEGLEYLSEFDGRRFGGLTPRLQRRLRETELVIHLIRHGTPLDVKFNIFARINTGGMALTAQELRHAIIPGSGRFILEQWAQTEEFKSATAHSVSGLRMEDRELVMRFIAFWMTPYQEYRDKDFDGFLAEAMRSLNLLSQEETDRIKEGFFRAMIAAKALFGNDAFRKRYSADARRSLINKALFEAWSVNLGKLTNGQVQNLLANREGVLADFVALCNDREFDSAISQGTSSPRKVSVRFTAVAELIKRSI